MNKSDLSENDEKLNRSNRIAISWYERVGIAFITATTSSSFKIVTILFHHFTDEQ